MEVHSAVVEKGEHAIIHGDRGVGKTSLANILDQRYIGAKVVKFTCNKESSLANIWYNIFRRIEINVPSAKKSAGFNSCTDEKTEKVPFSSFIDKEKLDLDEININLENISTSNENILIIIDEFDQIESVETRRSFANTIKFLSDNAVNITILLVGIGYSISDLLVEHQSIERCLRQVKLERMTDKELGKIIDHAEENLNMKVEKNVKSNIIAYSNGFPHFTHLIGKFVFLAAITNKQSDVTMNHFAIGIKQAINYVNESIKNSYQKAITSQKVNAIYKDVLYACALCKTDEQNTFRASDLHSVFKSKLKQNRKQQSYQYHLGRLCSDERGSILESIQDYGSRKRYRFSNPLVKAYIRIQFHISQQKI